MEALETDGVVKDPADYSVLIPVHSEALVLLKTVPALLASTGPDREEIVFVCNGCQDESASLLRHLIGDRAQIIELPDGEKSAP